MPRSLRCLPVLVLLIAVPTSGATPASGVARAAFVAAAAAAGTGTLTPGVGLVATPQHIDITFEVFALTTAATFAPGNSETANLTTVATGCRYVGNNAPETYLGGSGSGTLGPCTSGSVTGNVSYVRTLSAVTISGSVEIGGTAYPIFVAHCSVAGAGNPLTSFAIACTGTAQ